MSFRPGRAYAVFWKDILDLRKNRALLGSMLVMPVMLILVPAGVVYSYLHTDESLLRATATFYDSAFSATANARLFLIDRTLTDWFGIYLVMPVFVPILISSQAIAGEKERRTLEPLLASPVSAIELVVGKSLASLVPAVAITWIAFLVLCAAIDAVVWKPMHMLILPNSMWLFGVSVIAPLFAFFGNGIAVLISARVPDARTAQQIAGLFVLPLVGLVGVQVAGFLHAGTAYYAMQGAVVLVADVLLVFLTVRLFDRERLISRWT